MSVLSSTRNPSQGSVMQRLSKLSAMQDTPVYAKPITNQPLPPLERQPTENDYLDQVHPSSKIIYLANVIGILGFAYGIALTAYSCGSRYLTITFLSFIMCIICLSPCYRKSIAPRSKRVLFYGGSALYILILAIITFVFLAIVDQQIYCSSQWCHKDVETKDYFSYLHLKYSDSQLDSTCSALESKYSGETLNEQKGQFIVAEMAIYCSTGGGSCSSSNFYQRIFWLNIGYTRGILIALGILEILFALYLVIWLKMYHPEAEIIEVSEKSKLYAYDQQNNSLILDQSARPSIIGASGDPQQSKRTFMLATNRDPNNIQGKLASQYEAYDQHAHIQSMIHQKHGVPQYSYRQQQLQYQQQQQQQQEDDNDEQVQHEEIEQPQQQQERPLQQQQQQQVSHLMNQPQNKPQRPPHQLTSYYQQPTPLSSSTATPTKQVYIQPVKQPVSDKLPANQIQVVRGQNPNPNANQIYF